MRILMLSINQRTAGVELREQLALAGPRLEDAVDQLRRAFPAAEVVVVSTCNRTELYVARPVHEPPSHDDLLNFLAGFCRVDQAALSAAALRRENEMAVNHLFRVCAGLESMVLGEPQILGQVKRAYEFSAGSGAVGPVLHRVFQQSLAVAKQVRTETGIDAGRVSVATVAVDFARKVFDRFDDKTVVGIGAGEMAKHALKHLRGLGPGKLWVTNRSAERAVALADQLGLAGLRGGARPFEALDELLVEADIVLSSTGSPQPIITAERFRPLVRRRRSRPLFIVDLALPRDVEPAVGSLKNVYLYNLDDLQHVIEENYAQRREQVQACEALLLTAVKSCMSQVQHRDVGQLIRALRHRLHDLGRAEQERTLRKLSSAAPAEVPALLEEHTNRLVNKILHLPLSQLDQRQPDAPLGFYAAALRRLFDLEDDATGQKQDAPTSAGTDGAPATPPDASVSGGGGGGGASTGIKPDAATTPVRKE